MNWRLSAALAACKIAHWLSRRQGHKGSSLPGLVAQKLYPGTLRDLAAQVRRQIIIVSGTNGKTTTSNMIFGILRDAGYKTIANLDGANLAAGVTACFVNKARIDGKMDCDYAVLEVDEATIPAVFAELNAGIVVITNFFQDQLDRYGDLEQVVGIISNALQKKGKGITLVLNADDPLVAQLGSKTCVPAVYYGLAGSGGADRSGVQAKEARYCPFCRAVLNYEYLYYGQLGQYGCKTCGFSRPAARVEAKEPLVTGNMTSCRLIFDGREAPLTMQLQGLYNIYNAIAAFTASLLLGIKAPLILDGLQKYRPALGRLERFRYHGRTVYLNLVKNPTAFNESLATLRSMQGSKSVFFAINDHDADGKDISWLWDVNFETLNAHSDWAPFICSGVRGEEMALRLKYAGLPVEDIVVCKDIRQGIKNALANSADLIFLFSTYTALRPVHKIINSLADKEDFHATGVPSIS